MPLQPRRLLLALVVLVAGIVTAVHRHAAADDGLVRLAANRDTVAITSAERAGVMRFDPSVAPGDRAWIEAAIASARPEARRLIAEVDGMVTIHTASLGERGHGRDPARPARLRRLARTSPSSTASARSTATSWCCTSSATWSTSR